MCVCVWCVVVLQVSKAELGDRGFRVVCKDVRQFRPADPPEVVVHEVCVRVCACVCMCVCVRGV
jgi:hypothetical protein